MKWLKKQSYPKTLQIKVVLPIKYSNEKIIFKMIQLILDIEIDLENKFFAIFVCLFQNLSNR
jgi:hypothetical protein